MRGEGESEEINFFEEEEIELYHDHPLIDITVQNM